MVVLDYLLPARPRFEQRIRLTRRMSGLSLAVRTCETWVEGLLEEENCNGLGDLRKGF